MSRTATILVCSLSGQAGDPSIVGRFRDEFSRQVYLNGGKVVDSEPALHIAEFEDAESAMRAALATRVALKADDDPFPARMAISEGEIEDRDFTIVGKGLEIALALADATRDGQIVGPSSMVSPERVGARPGEPVGELAGETFVTLDDLPPPADPGPRDIPAAATPPDAPETAAEKAPSRRVSPVMIAVVAVLLIVTGVIVALMFGSGTEEQPGLTTSPGETASSGEEAERFRIALGGEDSALDDTLLVEKLVSLLLAHESEIVIDRNAGLWLEFEEVAPASLDQGREVETEETLVRARLSGELEGEGPLVDPSEPVVAATETVKWLAERLGVSIVVWEPPSSTTSDALVAALVDPSGSNLESLDEAVSGAPWGPAFAFLAEQYHQMGEISLQVEALRGLAAEREGDAAIWRSIAELLTREGRIAEAVLAWDEVLLIEPQDEKALLSVALAALIVGDEELIETIRARSPAPLPLHEGDLLDRGGDVAAAVRSFYETESAEPENLLTPFRVGRIGVMRRSLSVAELELEKLKMAGVEPEATLLEGYIAADAGNVEKAKAAVSRTAEMSEWEDSPHFHSAEVLALAKDTRGILREISRSVEAGEPRIGYVPADPLFRHLRSEPEFQEALVAIEARQQEISESLEKMRGL